MWQPPSPVKSCPPAPVVGQLAFYGIDDPQWIAVLLEHLQHGGIIICERTGDLLILPAPLDSRRRLDT